MLGKNILSKHNVVLKKNYLPHEKSFSTYYKLPFHKYTYIPTTLCVSVKQNNIKIRR